MWDWPVWNALVVALFAGFAAFALLVSRLAVLRAAIHEVDETVAPAIAVVPHK